MNPKPVGEIEIDGKGHERARLPLPEDPLFPTRTGRRLGRDRNDGEGAASGARLRTAGPVELESCGASCVWRLRGVAARARWSCRRCSG
jgi:hypothetical protein